MLPKFQYPIIQMAAESLGTALPLSKGGNDPPDVTTTWSKEGMKLIPEHFYQSCLTFLVS